MNNITKFVIIAGSLAVFPSLSHALECYKSSVCGTPVNPQTPKNGCTTFNLLEDTSRQLYYLNAKNPMFQHTYPTFVAAAFNTTKIELDLSVADPLTNCSETGATYVRSFWFMTVPAPQ